MQRSRRSQERLRQLLFGETPRPLRGSRGGGGRQRGPLLAANLTVASHLLGSNHVPDLQGAILIFEDVGEAPYRIRMLTAGDCSVPHNSLAALSW